MSAPRGLVGACLALWGWSIGQAWLGLVLGGSFEALRFARTREPAARLAPNVGRACALLALIALAYAVTQSLPQSLYNWLRWLPLLLMPLPALGLLAGGLRRRDLVHPRSGWTPPRPGDEVDLQHPFAAIALAAAGTGSAAQDGLYAGYVVLLGWALLARVPAPRRALAAILFCTAAATGYGIHSGIWWLQGQVEEWSTELLQDLVAGTPDPFRERTRIGDLGRVKLSDRILMRVSVEGPRPGELLLRESAFDRYRNGEWQNERRAPRSLAKEGEGWRVGPGPGARRVTVRRTMPGGEGLLPLPEGAREVRHLPAASLEAFASGAVRAHGTPRYVAFTVAYDLGDDRDAPGASDLEVPEVLAETLGRVLAGERLQKDTPAATLEAIQVFFATHFAYSLQLGDATRGAGARTLADFLLRDRKGHCEYFATATVLLLRQAGVPARYAAGFSAQEFNPREKAYMVRNRHAHAWVLAFIDGRWINVDTTPARWADLEGEAARSVFASLLDLASWLGDQVLQAWMDASWEGLALGASLWGAGLGLLWFLHRALRRRMVNLRPSRPDAIAAAWSAVERTVAAAGFPRHAMETARQWALRLADGHPGPSWRTRLVELSRAHYRVRFDPAASAAETAAFLEQARRWSLEG